MTSLGRVKTHPEACGVVALYSYGVSEAHWKLYCGVSSAHVLSEALICLSNSPTPVDFGVCPSWAGLIFLWRHVVLDASEIRRVQSHIKGPAVQPLLSKPLICLADEA